MKAEYLTHMGDDLMVVNSARVSFAKESEWEQVCHCGQDAPGYGFPCTHGGCSFENVLKGPDEKLISYLAKHNHISPFTHPVIQLRETVPIFVARQRFKHVVGFTYNEVSRRYVDDEPEFFQPPMWRKRAENKKQGSEDEPVENWLTSTNYRHHCYLSLKLYKGMIADGVCPEQARMVLPQSMMTSYYVTGSLAAWARAYKLRIDAHAQKEIQVLAEQWDKIIRPLFPVSWAALVD